MEKVDPRQRGGTILARSSEVAPERRPVTACALVRHPHDGELVAQQRRILGEPCDRSLPASRGTAEEIRVAVPDQARRVDDKALGLHQREGIHDPQEGVDRELVGAGKGHRPATLFEIHRSRKVTARDQKASQPAVARDDDVVER